MRKLLSIILILVAFGLTLENNPNGIRRRTINVSGASSCEITPNVAYFNLTVGIEKNDPQTAAQEGDKVRQSIKKVLRLKDIKQILQDATSISERWDYNEKKSYAVYNFVLEIKLTDFEKISELRKAIINKETFKVVADDWFTRKKLTINHSVNYEVDENQKQKAIRETVVKAYENALEKIKSIAQTSNFKYRISQVREVNNFPQPVYYSSKLAERSFNEESTEDKITVPTVQKFNASVFVEAEIIN